MVDLGPTHSKGKARKKKKKEFGPINLAGCQPNVCLTNVDESKIPPQPLLNTSTKKIILSMVKSMLISQGNRESATTERLIQKGEC